MRFLFPQATAANPSTCFAGIAKFVQAKLGNLKRISRNLLVLVRLMGR